MNQWLVAREAGCLSFALILGHEELAVFALVVSHDAVALHGDLQAEGGLLVQVLVEQYVLLHAKALPDPQVVEQGALLHLKHVMEGRKLEASAYLDTQVNDGHIRVVELVQLIRLPKVKLLKPDMNLLSMVAVQVTLSDGWTKDPSLELKNLNRQVRYGL